MSSQLEVMVEALIEQVARVEADNARLRSELRELRTLVENASVASVDNILEVPGSSEEVSDPTAEIFYGDGRYFIEGMTSDTRGTSLGAWKRSLCINHLAGTVTLSDLPIPVPFGSGEHWYDLRTSRGTIHVPLFS